MSEQKFVLVVGVHNYTPKHLDAAVQFMDATRDIYPYEEVGNPQHFPLESMDKALDVARKLEYPRVFVESRLDS